MKAVYLFLLASIPLSYAGCGFYIQSVKSGDNTCYLNAGHVTDGGANNVGRDIYYHNLDNYNEYNVFWQCAPGGILPVWYFENGTPGNRLFTKFPGRSGQPPSYYYLEADSHEDRGIGVDPHEFNAKVDRISTAKISYFQTRDSKGFGLLGYYHSAQSKTVGSKWVILQRDNKPYKYKYDVVTGGQVIGYEAQWEFYGDDAYKKDDNLVRLIAVSCPSEADPNPSSVYIQLPSQTFTYIVGLLFVLVLVNFVCCIYSNKSNKSQYKGVKNYDSETDAV